MFCVTFVAVIQSPSDHRPTPKLNSLGKRKDIKTSKQTLKIELEPFELLCSHTFEDSEPKHGQLVGWPNLFVDFVCHAQRTANWQHNNQSQITTRTVTEEFQKI